MQTQSRTNEYARLHSFHGSKRQLLGNQAGTAAPAWRGNTVGVKGKAPAESGSTIFLSKLPVDVGEKEVEELFNKTVGPLKESFLVYNSQGKSKGMAVVTFQRPGDALVARAKYNGRVVDGRRPIKIEIIIDDTPTARAAQAPPQTPTLFDRLAPAPAQTHPISGPMLVKPTYPAPRQTPYQPKVAHPAPAVRNTAPPVKEIPIPPRRFKVKKGPKRLKKRVTVADLDQEMEDYRASAPDTFTGLDSY
ncbi:hypothetical protein HYPSUDRAFT_730012 [Hypholoma sublateritium FD-334 SS-4]|uniref:RRM domain-containing protein n=1 Tax=Hypholoma sublateritium (strain FD-334 SS-4) TaxID=945553 RepID=A0A0D2NY21_HYPSF|nr:hypothetical protein HYPSUDRAFT_730012 [Hypholoma sublateritium FD-334 SS-4]